MTKNNEWLKQPGGGSGRHLIGFKKVNNEIQKTN